ncbi:unnamed protein product, partial [Amoebophrya sp. A120]
VTSAEESNDGTALRGGRIGFSSMGGGGSSSTSRKDVKIMPGVAEEESENRSWKASDADVKKPNTTTTLATTSSFYKAPARTAQHQHQEQQRWHVHQEGAGLCATEKSRVVDDHKNPLKGAAELARWTFDTSEDTNADQFFSATSHQSAMGFHHAEIITSTTSQSNFNPHSTVHAAAVSTNHIAFVTGGNASNKGHRSASSNVA